MADLVIIGGGLALGALVGMLVARPFIGLALLLKNGGCEGCSRGHKQEEWIDADHQKYSLMKASDAEFEGEAYAEFLRLKIRYDSEELTQEEGDWLDDYNYNGDHITEEKKDNNNNNSFVLKKE